MPQNIQQWMNEIRILQDQISNLQMERDEAYRSAESWQLRYQVEAKQHRHNVSELKRTILETQKKSTPIDDTNSQHMGLDQQIYNDVNDLSAHQLRSLVLKSLKNIKQLTQDLEYEKKEHAKTRQSLLEALSDTVDLLTKERHNHSRTHLK